MTPFSINIENLGNAVAILLVLSLVSERLSNLLKLHFVPESRIPTLNPIALWIWKQVSFQSKTSVSNADADAEAKIEAIFQKNRERYINWLSVISGIIVAILSGTNMLELLRDGSIQNSIGFLEHTGSLPGILLTGLFLSIGSRFFHDLLDIVLQIKRNKQQIADGAFQNVSSAKEVQDKANRTYSDIIERALEKFEKVTNLNGNRKGINELNASTAKDGTIFIIVDCNAGLPQDIVKVKSFVVDYSAYEKYSIKVVWHLVEIA